jgi:hypothetical protein
MTGAVSVNRNLTSTRVLRKIQCGSEKFCTSRRASDSLETGRKMDTATTYGLCGNAVLPVGMFTLNLGRRT